PVRALARATSAVLPNPRIGGRIEGFGPREVRRILVGHYEMRYELTETTIYVLRLWHTRGGR
ncbi:MAG: type II toxin-antitoxin system RelE/ParE family toxin, partial [Candidatus Accumulibacter sp.]|uniref:type II toxin-antitoxin system RelE/ParE family toxin n=1 Tax=Accumulibacter sp. TaxID=2053492 RepID=UPI001B25A729